MCGVTEGVASTVEHCSSVVESEVLFLHSFFANDAKKPYLVILLNRLAAEEDFFYCYTTASTSHSFDEFGDGLAVCYSIQDYGPTTTIPFLPFFFWPPQIHGERKKRDRKDGCTSEKKYAQRN